MRYTAGSCMKAALIGLVALLPASAEIYQGIGALDTLADIKAKLPGATFEQHHPAWAQDQDVIYSVTGEGLHGTIIIKFIDWRELWWHQLASATDEATIKTLTDLANGGDESVTVEWVRWAPKEVIPLKRLIAKYGPPEEKGFAQDDFQPYRQWKKKGLTAYLSDDEQGVVRIDYDFTQAERCLAWKLKYPGVPFLDAAGHDSCAPSKHPTAGKKTQRRGSTSGS
jgi:hypothetical protein